MDFIHGLVDRGFITHPYYPDLEKAVRLLAESWKLFCALPEDVKMQFKYFDDPFFDGSGYEHKRKEMGATFDEKENFHVTLHHIRRLREICKGLSQGESIRFMLHAAHLVDLIKEMLSELLPSLEQQLGSKHGKGLQQEIFEGTNHWIVRYLHYFPGSEVGSEIAVPHVDKSGLTLYLYESARGVQSLNWKREWRDMPVPSGQTIITGNMQLQYRAQCIVNALCHRVISTEKTAREGRYAIVCFIPFVKTSIYDKDGRGRLQDYPAGFFYGMPFADFKEYFTNRPANIVTKK